MAQHRVHVQRLERAHHLMKRLLLTGGVEANVLGQSLQAEMGEGTGLEDQTLFSNCHFDSALQDKHEEIDRLALLENDVQGVVLRLRFHLDAADDVLIEETAKDVLGN